MSFSTGTQSKNIENSLSSKQFEARAFFFTAWDVSVDKLRRRRLYEPLNRIKDRQERIFPGENIVRQMNRELREVKVLGKDKFAEQNSERLIGSPCSRLLSM